MEEALQSTRSEAGLRPSLYKEGLAPGMNWWSLSSDRRDLLSKSGATRLNFAVLPKASNSMNRFFERQGKVLNALGHRVKHNDVAVIFFCRRSLSDA
jgi:hypothetical protein